MRITLTGATGIVGSFVIQALQRAGHQVTPLGRDTGYRLGDSPDLTGQDALIHCAFAHLPGRYRGGEGTDPDGFRDANLTGSIRLFDAAARDGIGRILFLSSRAVHDGHPPGTILTDDLPPRPETLYGEVKALAEAHLQTLQIPTTSIRATGIYGPGRANKWAGLFSDFLNGKAVPSRVATEFHADDLSAAILLLLNHPVPPPVVNASDITLDNHDLLTMVARLTGCTNPPPPRADASTLRVLRCDRLAAMGWQPGGLKRLAETLPHLI